MGFRNKVSVVEPDGFREKFQIWFDACNQLREDELNNEHSTGSIRYGLRFKDGPKYIKITATQYAKDTGKELEYSASTWAFIDRTNGNVLKGDGQTPAKGPRGNIFDEHNGMGRIGALSGPAYNR